MITTCKLSDTPTIFCCVLICSKCYHSNMLSKASKHMSIFFSLTAGWFYNSLSGSFLFRCVYAPYFQTFYLLTATI